MHVANLLKIITSPAIVLTGYWTLVSKDTTLLHSIIGTFIRNSMQQIEEKDKALILLNSLPDEEYETFTLTLINGKQTLNYSEVSATIINCEGGRISCLLLGVHQQRRWR